MKCCYELDIQITEEYKKRVKEVYDLCRDNAKKDVAPDFMKEDFPERSEEHTSELQSH